MRKPYTGRVFVAEGSALLQDGPRVGFAPPATYQQESAFDAIANCLAQRDVVLVSRHNHPAALAAVRQAGPQIVVTLGSWRPQEPASTTLNPVPIGRVWDHLWDPQRQLVAPSSHPDRTVRILSTHLLQIAGEQVVLTGPEGEERGSYRTAAQAADWIVNVISRKGTDDGR